MMKNKDASAAAIAVAAAQGEPVADIARRTGLPRLKVRRLAAAGRLYSDRAADPVLDSMRETMQEVSAAVRRRVAQDGDMSPLGSERLARAVSSLSQSYGRLYGGAAPASRGSQASAILDDEDDDTEALGRELAERLERLRQQVASERTDPGSDG